MRAQPRVVIIGGGIVGCGAAHFLTKLGWRNVTLLEQGPLVENWGSTSHAPGMMFEHNVSQTMTRLAMWSVDLYAEVAPRGENAFHQVGSLELASTPERWEELKRRLGQAWSWGLEARLIDPDEIRRLVPVLRTDDLYGAFHVPRDCAVRAGVVAGELAKRAEAAGARVHAHTPVTGIEVTRGRVRAVETSAGRLEADVVVCAGGIWGPTIGRWAGAPIPLQPMQHLFVKTAPLPELAGETLELRHPIVRDQDKDLYFRQYGEAYGFGSYRHDPLPVEPDELPRNDHPAIFDFTPEHFAESLRDAQHRIPALCHAELVTKFNGLFSFTADGFPLLGESPDVRGFWSAEAVWITHAGGVGRALAEWIVEGAPSIDLRECDINRFPAHALSRPYVRARSNQAYVEVYDVIHPAQPFEHPRGLRRTPYHERLRELGAVFFEGAGWERPQWFESNAPLLAGADWPARAGWTARHWSPISGAEHRATRERVGLFDLTPFTKIRIAGPGALAFLNRVAANELDRPVGKVTYTTLLDERGGVEADVTVTRLAEAEFLLVTGSVGGLRDLARLRRQAPDDGSVQVADVTSAYCCVGVWGPRARDLVTRLSDDDWSTQGFPYLTARRATVAFVPVLAVRVSYAGEQGWELYAPPEFGAALWEALWDAGRPLGAVPAGVGALDSLRLEKGYRLAGADLRAEFNPYEAGLGFTVKPGKGDFVGREALLRARERGVRRKLCCLTFEDPAVVVMGREPILDGEAVLGFVTSANFGYTVGRSIAYGYLPAEYAEPGTRVEVQFFGVRHPAAVSREPLYDPSGERLRV